MADIKLADIFGGVGGMSDQVVINKNDIAQLRTDLGTKVSKSGDTMSGKLVINRAGTGWPVNTVSNSNNFANRALLAAVTDNNALFIFGDGGFNSRRFGIQSGHADAGYTTTYGVLDLNPFGGVVRANGYQVYTGSYKQPDIPVNDIRGEDRKPSYFTGRTVTGWFNQTGLPTSSWYAGITVKGWENTYNAWQLFSNSSNSGSDNKLHFRTGNSDVWNTTYEVYHSGRKPSPGDLGAYTKTEVDNTFARKGGEIFVGAITSTASFAASTANAQFQHFGNGTDGNPINIRSMREHHSATWVWEKIANGQLRYSTGTNGGDADKITLDVSNGIINAAGELRSSAANGLRFTYSDMGAIFRHADNRLYILATNSGDKLGGFNSLRPFIVDLSNGRIEMQNGLVSPIINSTGAASGQGFTFNAKTVIGGTNDGWLRINPHSQFAAGIYCGSTGTLRHDGNIQRGSWGSNAAAIIRVAYDSTWSGNGSAAYSYTQVNSAGAHWLLASYKDSTNIRSGIQILSADTGVMRLYTNMRNNFVTIDAGNITAQNNVTSYSDIRVKKNISPIENALQKTLSITGVTYDRTDQDNVRQVGLIAQEVEKVLPEAVITSVNGDIKDFKSVAYGNLVGLLVESIRELNNKIERLEALVKE